MVTFSSGSARTVRIATAAVGIATILAITSACSSGAGSTKALAPITLQTSWVPSVQFGGTYIAEDKGYYTKHGVKVTVLPGGPDTDVLAAVASGRADIGMENADTIAEADAKGAGLVIVGAGMPKNPLIILSTAAHPIRKPSDMEGKTIGVPTADAPSEDAIVKANGLDASKIKTVPVGFDVAPLVSGEVDGIWAIYSSQPVAYQTATGKAGVTMLAADYGLNMYTQVYVVKKSALQDPTKKAAIENFLKGEIEGWQAYLANPAEAVNLTVNKYAKSGGLKISDVTAQAKLQEDLVVTADTKAHGLFWMSADGIESNLKTLSALKIPASKSMFDNSLLKDIYKGKNSIK